MSAERILFVTGRLAEVSLRELLIRLAPKVGFDYDVAVLGISVAALMSVDFVARKLALTSRFDRVLLPGWCGGDLTILAEKFGPPFERGPKDLLDLPEYFGDRDQISRVDLCLVFLCAATPHGALDPRLALQRVHRAVDNAVFGQLAHAHARQLAGRHAQGHLVLLELDDEQFQRDSGNFLLFDPDDTADAVCGINDGLTRLETVARAHRLLRGQCGSSRSRVENRIGADGGR